jgi:hypothetical protein
VRLAPANQQRWWEHNSTVRLRQRSTSKLTQF